MEQNINHPSMSLIVTGCLLLHCALLYILGVIDTHPTLFARSFIKEQQIVEEESIEENNIPQEQSGQEDWVAMDSFGAPIIFQEEIEIPRAASPSQQQAIPPQLRKESPKTLTQESSEQHSSPTQQHTTDKQHVTPEVPQSNTEIERQEPIEDGMCTLQAEMLPQMVCELSYEHQTSSGKPSEKPPLSFAQLAQGFMQYSQRQTYLPVVSNKRGFASPEQIRAMNYMQRILQELVTSYRCVNHTVAGVVQPQPATITFMLNRDGSLHSKQIVHSTGSKALDDFFLALIDDASQSFPPVPDTLPVPFILPYINFNDPRCFQHVGNWMFQNFST